MLTVNNAVQSEISGALSGNGALVKKGAEKLTLTGSVSDFNGMLELREGTLELNAANFNGSAAYNLTLGGGTLQLDNAELSLHGGALNMTGNTTISISGIDVSSLATVSGYSDGVDRTNGYRTDHRELISAGSATMAEGAVLTAGTGLQGENLVLIGNSICIQGAPAAQGGVYYINSAVDYGTTATNTAYEKATTLELNKAGAVLNLNRNLNSVCTDGITTAAANGIVRIGDGVTLNQAQLNATQAVKLSGTGTYSITQAYKPSNNITWDKSWTGTVDVHTEGDNNTNIKLEELGQKGSTVRLNGTQGYLTRDVAIAADIDLNGKDVAALKITNGYSDTVITFNGAVKGTGNLEKNWASGGSSCALEFDFNGNTSAWVGAFVNSAKWGDSTLVFANEAKAMGAAIRTTEAAKTHIKVGADENETDIVFQNTIQATSLNLLGNSSATLEKNAALTQVESHGGTLKLDSNAELKVGAALQISANDTVKNATGIILGSISFNADASGTYAVSGTEEAMGQVANTLVELAEATSLKLENVVVTADSIMQAADSATNGPVIDAQNLVLHAALGTNATLAKLNDGYTPMTLAAGNSTEPEEPSADAVLTLNNLHNITVTGSKLTINLEMDRNTLQEIADTYTMVGITLGSLSGFEAVESVLVTCNGILLEDTYRSDDGGMVFFDAAVLPEPTTGTLSLLALAALCARRRRK